RGAVQTPLGREGARLVVRAPQRARSRAQRVVSGRDASADGSADGRLREALRPFVPSRGARHRMAPDAVSGAALDDRSQTPAPLDTAANLRWTCVLGPVHAFMHELRPASFASSIFAAPVTRGFAIDHLRGRGRFPRREGRIPSGPALSVRRSTTAMSTEMDKE